MTLKQHTVLGEGVQGVLQRITKQAEDKMLFNAGLEKKKEAIFNPSREIVTLPRRTAFSSA